MQGPSIGPKKQTLVTPALPLEPHGSCQIAEGLVKGGWVPKCRLVSTNLVQVAEKRATRSLRADEMATAQGRVGDYAARWIAEHWPVIISGDVAYFVTRR